MSEAAYASHHDRMPWGDREIGRFNFRVSLFQRRGLDLPDAETLADRLYERDFERDDRRVCLECKGLQRSGHCVPAKQGRLLSVQQGKAAEWFTPPQQLLQRCEGFEFVTP